MNHLELNFANATATVTLNRPDVRNAFNDEVIAELTTAFRELGQRDDVRCIVLTGSYSLYCAVIVKKVDAKTLGKVGINELLRGI